MSPSRQLMTCPTCGHTMNAHAEKPVEPRDETEAVAVLLIEEVHHCPKCGNVESRRISA
jgi:exosome complex RNA-binding protein Csl4